MAKPNSSIGWISVPPVAAIGWIPYYVRLTDVPQNNYTHTWPKFYDYLFDSGNKDPEDDLTNEQGFLQIIKSRDFRGAFLLNGLKLYRTPDRFIEHSRDFRRMEYVGYTPIRSSTGKAHPPKKDRLMRQGVGGSYKDEPNPKIDLTPDYVRITQRVDFRICKLLQLLGGFASFTLRGAPYAWMEMDFTIYHNGSYRIEFSGTSVPSQQLYIDWRRVASCRYDMLQATAEEMERFLEAGRLFYFPKAVRAPRRFNAPLVANGELW